MTQQIENGRQDRNDAANQADQSLDRGYGGLPGEPAGDDIDADPIIDKPFDDKEGAPRKKPDTQH